MSDQHWYSISNIETVPSPQLVIYADRVLHNIQKAVEMIGDPSRLRPHIKTNKCREVVKMMMDAENISAYRISKKVSRHPILLFG